MSLINDALKRASSSKPAPAAPVSATLQPVPDKPRTASPLPLVLCIVGIGALLIAAAFWLKAKGTVSQIAAVAPTTTQSPTEAPVPAVTLPKVATEPVPAPLVGPTAITSARPLTNLAPVTKVEQPAAVAPASQAVAPPKVEPAPGVLSNPPAVSPEPVKAVAPGPQLRLQAVYYRLKGPTVVINGRTLRIGDYIDRAKLVEIERNAAIVELDGSRRRLTLP